MALSLGLAHKDDADAGGAVGAWLLNGKAVDQESLASSLLLARQSSDPALGNSPGSCSPSASSWPV